MSRCLRPAASWVKKVGKGQKVAIFPQTAANFRQKRLWVMLKISNLLLSSQKWRIFSPELCILGRRFFERKKIFRQAKIWGGALAPARRRCLRWRAPTASGAFHLRSRLHRQRWRRVTLTRLRQLLSYYCCCCCCCCECSTLTTLYWRASTTLDFARIVSAHVQVRLLYVFLN